MASEPTDYVKLPIRQFPPKALRETSEGRYWKSFRCIASEKSVRFQTREGEEDRGGGEGG